MVLAQGAMCCHDNRLFQIAFQSNHAGQFFGPDTNLLTYTHAALMDTINIKPAIAAMPYSVIRSDSVIKLVSVLFGKCTSLVITKC